MGKNTPRDFDVDAWLDGLSRPQRSVRVYQRGDIMAQLDDLAAQIENAESVDDGERGLVDASPASLRAQYAQLAEEMKAASLLVTVQGHDRDEKVAALKGAEDASPVEVARTLIFDALVSPKMNREQFDRFMSGIGPAQQDRVAEAYTRACGEVPGAERRFFAAAFHAGRGRLTLSALRACEKWSRPPSALLGARSG